MDRIDEIIALEDLRNLIGEILESQMPDMDIMLLKEHNHIGSQLRVHYQWLSDHAWSEYVSR